MEPSLILINADKLAEKHESYTGIGGTKNANLNLPLR